MSTVEEIHSAPGDLILLPHAVLHVVTILCHMEYSQWSVYGDIWSTPCVHYFMPHGVIHRALKTSPMELFVILPETPGREI